MYRRKSPHIVLITHLQSQWIMQIFLFSGGTTHLTVDLNVDEGSFSARDGVRGAPHLEPLP